MTRRYFWSISNLYILDYTCVIFGGLTALMCAFYLFLRKGYKKPQIIALGANAEMTTREYRNSIAEGL